MTDISDEYKKMLRDLHEDYHSVRQEGEFTIEEYQEANKERLNMMQAENELEEMCRRGRVIKGAEKRYINSRHRTVYTKVSTPENAGE